MNSVDALKTTDMTEVAVAITIGIVVLGLLIGIFLTALFARVIILVIAVGLGVYVWQQRASIEDHVKKCDLNISFFGYHVDSPPGLIKHCRSINH